MFWNFYQAFYDDDDDDDDELAGFNDGVELLNVEGDVCWANHFIHLHRHTDHRRFCMFADVIQGGMTKHTQTSMLYAYIYIYTYMYMYQIDQIDEA